MERKTGNKRQNLSDNRTTMENKELLFTFNWKNDTLTTYFFLCTQVRDTQNVRF